MELEANIDINLNADIDFEAGAQDHNQIEIEVEPPNVDIEFGADVNAELEVGGDIQVDIESNGRKSKKLSHTMVPKQIRGPKTKMQRILDSNPVSKEGTQIFIWDEGQGEFDFSGWDPDTSKGVSYDEFVKFGESLKDTPHYDSSKLIICTRVWCVLVNIIL